VEKKKALGMFFEGEVDFVSVILSMHNKI